MKTRMLIPGIALLLACQGAVQAQSGNTISAGAKKTADIIKGYITRSATKVPEDLYSFKPTPEVRSFGQVVAHIADANFGFCAAAAGEKPPMGGFEGPIEKSKTTKADLEKALAESFAYCDKVHASLNDTTGAATVKLFGNDMAKLSVLDFKTAHDFEHYGNLVTYMRLKNIVPPSSEKQGSM
jgi:uncharacterized damage-inducible protein DinB